MLNVDIIQADVSMCKELSCVKKLVWETTYRGIYPDKKLDYYNLKEHEEKFKSQINSKDLKLYVAISNKKIIGYTAIGKSPHRPNSEETEIVLLYVLKDFQGIGVGKKLFNFAKEKIKSINEKRFVVYCNKYNISARKFYEKMGGILVSSDHDNKDRSLPQVKFVYNI